MRNSTWCILSLIGLLQSGCTAEPPSADSGKTPAEASHRLDFVDIAANAGLNFKHDLPAGPTFFFPEIMSPGAAMFDFDGDGDLDLYFVNGSKSPFLTKTANGVETGDARNRLFRQESDGNFVDITELSRLGDSNFGMGVAVGDINNDGLPDVYLTNYGPDQLYLNRGHGTFENITEQAGIENTRWSASAAFFDYNRDGWLDLFVTNYADYQPDQPCYTSAGVLDYCNPAKFPPTSDRLFLNLTGKSLSDVAPESDSESIARIRFEDVSLSSGIATGSGAGLGVICADLTDDGWPDIYVANDGNENRLWVNLQNGTFRDEAVLRGVAFDALGRNQASMGTALGDLNGDRLPDIVLTHLEGEYNTLYLSSQGGTFQDSSKRSGLFDSSLATTGFGVALLDLDHDGDLDLTLANGRVRRGLSGDNRAVSQRAEWEIYAESNQILWNDGNAQFRVDSGHDFEFSKPVEISRALVAGDIDNDGDLDFLITNTAGVPQLYRNDLPEKGHWLNVRAIEPMFGGRDAIGAVVSVYSKHRNWLRIVAPGTSYCSSHDPRLHFGLGEFDSVDAIEILWPDGQRERFPGCKPDQFLVLRRGEGVAR